MSDISFGKLYDEYHAKHGDDYLEGEETTYLEFLEAKVAGWERINVSNINAIAAGLLAKQSLEAKVEELSQAVETLTAANSELRGQGNMTAAEYLEEWWGCANVQGVATMDGEEMLEMVFEMAASSPPEPPGEQNV